MADPAQVSYVLASIASASKIIESAITLVKSGMRADFTTLKAEADAFGRDAVAHDAAEITIIASSIPQNIIDAAEAGMNGVYDDIADILGNHALPQVEATRRLSQKEERLCWYISQLSKYGRVPDTMMAAWNKLQCSSKGYTLS